MNQGRRLHVHRGGRTRPKFEAPDDPNVPTLGWTLDQKYQKALEALDLVQAIGWDRARRLARQAKTGSP